MSSSKSPFITFTEQNPKMEKKKFFMYVKASEIKPKMNGKISNGKLLLKLISVSQSRQKGKRDNIKTMNWKWKRSDKIEWKWCQASVDC